MSYAVVKGERLRVTKTNNCGLPLPGAANRLVTDGFIEIGLTPEMKAAEELETTNAAGRVCVKDRTPAERKRWNVAANFCDVDPDLWALIAAWTRVLGYDGKPIGVRDRKTVDSTTGVMIELWTGGESDDDCPLPTDDSIFSSTTSGQNWGYMAFMATEFTADGLTVNAQPSTYAFTGITKAAQQWGRGPYNVAGRDALGTPGRLLVPFYDEEDDNHLIMFRSPVAPPEVTDGAVPLDIIGKFVAPNYYFGAVPNLPAADVAPEQTAVGQGYELKITAGTPTAGGFGLKINYLDGTSNTVAITFNSTAAAAKTALVAPDDGYDASEWTVAGATALPTGTLVITPPPGVTLSVVNNTLTPTSTVTLTPQ